MRPNKLLVSAVTALTAAILIAVIVSVFDGWNWKEPLGIFYYAGLFVLPFTLVGTFLVVGPVHFLAARTIPDVRMQIGFIIISSAIAGGIMLQLISNEVVPAAIMGALSGLTTAVLWLALYSRLSRSFGND